MSSDLQTIAALVVVAVTAAWMIARSDSEHYGRLFVYRFPKQKVVFTFGWEEKDHPIPPGSTTVEITLHREGDKTRVRLVHRGLPTDASPDPHPTRPRGAW